MSQSVKLTDGSYIDSAGVWDNVSSKALDAVLIKALGNGDHSMAMYSVATIGSTTTVSIDLQNQQTSVTGLIFERLSIVAFCVARSTGDIDYQTIKTVVGQEDRCPLSCNGTIATFTIPAWDKATILYFASQDVTITEA